MSAAALTADQVAFARSLVLCEDAEVLALNKPAGLSSQGGRIAAPTLDDLLAAFAKKSGVRPRLVHRLDRDTSGVILAAKSKAAAAFLGRAMMARRVAKTYLALVAPGAPAPLHGQIEIPLWRQDIGREAYVRPAADGQPGAMIAGTRYRTLAATARAGLVELTPATGRMHQLRVHLASIGRPILGDVRYGGALVIDRLAAPRLMLHAAALAFPHPAGGEMRVAAPIPEDFERLAAALGLQSDGYRALTEGLGQKPLDPRVLEGER